MRRVIVAALWADAARLWPDRPREPAGASTMGLSGATASEPVASGDTGPVPAPSRSLSSGIMPDHRATRDKSL